MTMHTANNAKPRPINTASYVEVFGITKLLSTEERELEVVFIITLLDDAMVFNGGWTTSILNVELVMSSDGDNNGSFKLDDAIWIEASIGTVAIASNGSEDV